VNELLGELMYMRMLWLGFCDFSMISWVMMLLVDVSLICMLRKMMWFLNSLVLFVVLVLYVKSG